MWVALLQAPPYLAGNRAAYEQSLARFLERSSTHAFVLGLHQSAVDAAPGTGSAGGAGSGRACYSIQLSQIMTVGQQRFRSSVVVSSPTHPPRAPSVAATTYCTACSNTIAIRLLPF